MMFDLTRKFRSVIEALRCLKVKSAILDWELVALDDHGRPDFKALTNLCLWCFDLLELNGVEFEPCRSRDGALGSGR